MKNTEEVIPNHGTNKDRIEEPYISISFQLVDDWRRDGGSVLPDGGRHKNLDLSGNRVSPHFPYLFGLDSGNVLFKNNIIQTGFLCLRVNFFDS